jgi:hypothetical protein
VVTVTTSTWQLAGAPPVRGLHVFRPGALRRLPDPASAYLRHAIAEGVRIPRSVRLTMHGHIRLGAWLPFTAEQTIDAERGFWWTARVAGGLFTARDELDRGRALTHARLGGLVPVLHVHSPDVVRSALGRFLAERSVWLPGTLLPYTGTQWSVDHDGRAAAMVPDHDGFTRVALGVDPDGRLLDVAMCRWGRDHGRAGWVPFGMVAEEEATFGGFTVASKGRAGWWYGTPRWPAGEFFRFTVDDYVAF